MLLFVYVLDAKKFANACAQTPKARHNDGQRPLTRQQTVMRQEYAKTAERGLGRLQRFVSHAAHHRKTLLGKRHAPAL